MYKKIVKKIIDFLSSFVALSILLPLIACIAIIIKTKSSGPIFFRQKRIGKGGKEFNIYKFRTMETDTMNAGSYYTLDNDKRIYPFGKFLRKSSLDEIPQLFNVFLGDMSLIGPRPDLPIQKKNYSKEDWEKRYLVKPGITGLSQINGRSLITPENRLKYDLKYVREVSFMLDLKIALKTFTLLFTRKGCN